MTSTFTNQSGPSIDLEQIIADIERVTKAMNQLKKLTLWQWYLVPPGRFMRFEEPDEIIFAGSKETWQKTFHKLSQCDPSVWCFGPNKTPIIDLAHNPDEEGRARRLMMAKLETMAGPATLTSPYKFDWNLK